MNVHVKQKISLTCLAIIFVLATTAVNCLALTLHEAKDQGLIGEKPNGYIGAVTKEHGLVDALIKDVNGKRRQKYREIAKRDNTSLRVVELLAGEIVIKKTKPGNYIQLSTGRWVKK